MKLALSILALAVTCAAQAQTGPADGPVTLEQAIQEALGKNLDLAAERLNISVAEAREITARLRPNPVLTVAGQTLDVLGARYSPDTPLGPNQMNIHTDVPIERGGKRAQRIAVARADVSIAQLGVREVMRKVIGSVQSAFVDVQHAKENLKLAQENLKSLEGVVAINEARLNSGDLAQVELERSRVAALQYRTAVDVAQLQLDQAKSQLQLLIGRREKSPSFDVTDEIRHDDVPASADAIVSLALSRRPDYLTEQQTQARSQADLRLQLANAKVDNVIGVEYTRQSAWGVSGNSLGLYFSMPLRIFNRNQGEVARAQRESTLAAARILALEATIRTEVENAYREYSVSKRMLASIETEMLARARMARDTTEYSYRRGEASLVEYLDAQRAFNDAMQTRNEARANYSRSLYLIDTVSGQTVSGS